MPQPINPLAIISATCRVLNVHQPTVMDMAENRALDVLRARECAVGLMHELTGYSFPSIAEVFRCRQHSTVHGMYQRWQLWTLENQVKHRRLVICQLLEWATIQGPTKSILSHASLSSANSAPVVNSAA